MCDPVTLTALAIGTAGGIGMKYLDDKNNKKDKAQMNSRIDALEKSAADQIEANKLANGVQSTTPIEEQDLKQKLAAQKIPLNTTNTGLAVGNGLSTGLNLGGY